MKPLRKKRGIVILIMAILGLFLCFLFRRLIDPYPPVEMTSQEVINAWMEEQAQGAKEFFNEHEELFAQIKEAALSSQITESYTEYCIEYQNERLSLLDYRLPGIVGHVYQGSDSIEYPSDVTVADLSPILEEKLIELNIFRQTALTYHGPDSPHGRLLLELSYANEEFPTAIFCSVTFEYDPSFSPVGEFDLGNGWHIQTDYHYMYGL